MINTPASRRRVKWISGFPQPSRLGASTGLLFHHHHSTSYKEEGQPTSDHHLNTISTTGKPNFWRASKRSGVFEPPNSESDDSSRFDVSRRTRHRIVQPGLVLGSDGCGSTRQYLVPLRGDGRKFEFAPHKIHQISVAGAGIFPAKRP